MLNVNLKRTIRFPGNCVAPSAEAPNLLPYQIVELLNGRFAVSFDYDVSEDGALLCGVVVRDADRWADETVWFILVVGARYQNWEEC